MRYFSVNENLEFLREQNIAFVEKKDNPPSASQIRPIENYWGILQMEVYAWNWEARGENKREKLIRRIKECQKKIDQNVIIKMFDNLKAKVIKRINLDWEVLTNDTNYIVKYVIVTILVKKLNKTCIFLTISSSVRFFLNQSLALLFT